MAAKRPDEFATDIIRTKNALDTDREVFKVSWQEITDNMMPRKNEISTKRERGSKRTSKRYSSTGEHAHGILSAALHGAMSSSSVQWFGFSTGKSEIDEVKEVRDFFDKSSEILWKAFNSGKFHTQVHEAYLDITGLGTACILQEPDGVDAAMKKLVFTTFSIQDYVFEEASNGLVDTVYLTRHYTGRQAIKKYGAENVSAKLKTAALKDPTARFRFVQVIGPVEDFEGKKTPDGMAFYTAHIEEDMNMTAVEGGYHEFPCAVPRWAQSSGEQWGRGPGNCALPDIKVLNEATRLELNAWAKAIDPPLLMEEDGVVGGRLDMRPGKGNTVRSLDNSVKAFETKARFDVNRIKLDEYRDSIRMAFFADQLELPTTSTMTATEVQVRFDLMQRILGPILGRLEYELQNPLIGRGFNILLRAGFFPPMPEILAQALSDGEVSISYVGPLSRAQKQQEISGTLRWLEAISAVAQINPQSLDLIDFDAVQRSLHKNSEQNENFMRTEKVVDDLRKAREEAQKQQQAMEQTQQAAGIASDLGTAGAADLERAA